MTQEAETIDQIKVAAGSEERTAEERIVCDA